MAVKDLPELESAINENTAMMEYTYGETGPVKLEEAVAICKRRGVPFMVDGAATCPPFFERLKQRLRQAAVKAYRARNAAGFCSAAKI